MCLRQNPFFVLMLASNERLIHLQFPFYPLDGSRVQLLNAVSPTAPCGVWPQLRRFMRERRWAELGAACLGTFNPSDEGGASQLASVPSDPKRPPPVAWQPISYLSGYVTAANFRFLSFLRLSFFIQ